MTEPTPYCAVCLGTGTLYAPPSGDDQACGGACAASFADLVPVSCPGCAGTGLVPARSAQR